MRAAENGAHDPASCSPVMQPLGWLRAGHFDSTSIFRILASSHDSTATSHGAGSQRLIDPHLVCGCSHLCVPAGGRALVNVSGVVAVVAR